MDYIQLLFGDDFTVISLRLFIALVLSGLIGFERELNNHSAGFRTHILVGVGSCLMMLMSIYGFTSLIDTYENVRFDPARIPSYVISGIGFLGAGTIIVYGGTIRGLTTAASIWTVAGLGLIVGLGMYGAALLATLIILVSLVLLNNFERLFPKTRNYHTLEIKLNEETKVYRLVELFEHSHLRIKSIEVTSDKNDIRVVYIRMEKNRKINLAYLYGEISKLEGIRSISKLNY
ncbi:MgtC/SapB family protein [Oceanobacillus senegalensis]|uniref:MgtC/SapB family protein n=1 Tax=Oceanobacillus senegalensis TaxID=1936063 RepID=UPI000A3063C5|nr:MgtC/SapB family protein [Oceanobacillus senegalensis]